MKFEMRELDSDQARLAAASQPGGQANWLDTVEQARDRVERQYGTKFGLYVCYDQQIIFSGDRYRSSRDELRSTAGRTSGAFSYGAGVEQSLWKGGSLVAGVGGGSGDGLEKIFPTFSGLNDNAAEPDCVYLGEFYLQQKVLGGRLSAMGGVVDLQDWFDTNAAANDGLIQFVSSSLVNNPTIPFPLFSPGVVVVGKPTDWLYLQTGLAYNLREDAFFPQRYDYLKENYLFNIYELGLTPEIRGLYGNYRFMFWLDHRDTLEIDTDPHRDNRGFALSFDQQVTKRITLFARYGLTSQEVLPTESFWSIGGELTAPLPGRNHDAFGMGMAQSIMDHEFIHSGNRAWAETTYEVYYRIQIGRFLSVTPNVQFMTNADARNGADCAVVGGIRFVLSF